MVLVHLSGAHTDGSAFFPGITLSDMGRAMLCCVRANAPKTVLEAKDIQELAKRAAD